MAAKFVNHYGKGKVIVLEPSDDHYYQPLFTLVGGGMKKTRDAHRSMKSVLPSSAKWIKDSAVQFDPDNNTVYTDDGDKIEYEILVIGMGLKLNYDQIPGLVEGLKMKNSGVCSNYSPKYVDLTFECLKNFKSGNAIFTFPNSPVKCPGAPQKICYISEHYFRKTGKSANIIYNTALPVIFGVKHYADALWELVKERDIKVNLRTNLIEVFPDKKQAIFQNLDSPNIKSTIDYEMLHVTPPMSTPHALAKSSLVDSTGFVDVQKDNLQHKKYKNIFAIGDSSNSPNSKTAAAAAAQAPVIYQHALNVLEGKTTNIVYDGYASCPIVTGYDTCILAEFDYNLQPLETFPFAQNKERHSMFYLKKYFMSPLYWELMMRGYWNGPKLFRNMMGFMKFQK